FTAAGGVAYQFWRDGVPQGGFSPANTYSPSGLSSNTTISVRIVDANTCQDSTVAGDGAGREPVALQVKTTPNISGWSLTRIPGCPEDPVRILINAPNIQTGAYWFDWELDAQPVQTLQQNIAGGVGILDIGVQPAGSHLGRISNIRLGSNGCPTTPPGGSSVGFEVKPLIATTLDTVICAGQSVKVGGQVFTQTGSYQVVLPTATAKCDSTVTLELQVVTVFQIERTARICYKGTYIFYGDTLKSAGFYQKTIPGTFGCDSLIRLVLSEESPVFDFLTKTICPGTAFTVGDSIFTQPGIYNIPLKSKVTGCDSTLILTLKWPATAPAVLFPADSLRVCSGASLSLAPTVQHCNACKYKWNNGATLPNIFVSPTANTSYSVTVTDPSSSCTAAASVTLLPIAPIFIEQDTLLCPGEKLKWCGKDIAQAGQYPCTFQTAEGCDSTVTLQVSVFSGNLDAIRDSLSLPLGVLQQDYKVEERLLQNDILSGDYEIRLVQQPQVDSVVLLDGGSLLRYLLRTGPRFGVDSFRYAICPPNGCTALCDSAWVRVRLQNGDLDWVQSHMPSLVTPEDGDDMNPVFDPLGFLRNSGSIFPDEESVRFYVMSRWGEVVHRPYPYEPWDGTQGRSSLPQATYYYRLVFEIGGERYELKGPINLLK
ncbi:MAG TPA: gliding motility-associated C-terminal domain-containing protein, partial [Saprospiraceae bacterium]|nr:gliding motility-associated C-terminal domain-containing protein [Saprospiraceae bacterium]